MEKFIRDFNEKDKLINFYTIRVRLLKKTEMKEYSNSTTKKTGHKFNCLFIDQNADYIESICFLQTKFDELHENEVYNLQKFVIQKPSL